jgi:pimeloyl-ACP methyl ester carboxylesterase
MPSDGASRAISRIRHGAAFAPSEPAIYYDRLRPDPPTGRPPLVLVHGGGHTGACYHCTPDGRPGWAPLFAGLGYTVIVPDWPGVGRSGRVDPALLTGDVVCTALGALIESLDEPCVLLTHSMSGAWGWRLLETHGRRIRALVGVAPAPPGNIQPVPDILSRGDGYVEVMRGAFRRRVDRDRPTPFDRLLVEQKLVGDGDRFPRAAFTMYERSLIANPPRLAWERSNIEGSQVRVREVAALKGKPVLVVSADHDPDHTQAIDGPVVDWLRAAGARAEHCWLPDRGISGNGHMMMLESNNADIAALIAAWIDANT